MKTSSVLDDKWPLGNAEHGTVFVQIVYFQLSGVLEGLCACVCGDVFPTGAAESPGVGITTSVRNR